MVLVAQMHQVRAEYDETNNVWCTHLADGEVLVSRYFVSASGLLVEPRMPNIPGIGSFDGKLVHSARWDHDYDLEGKRVAVIGTGATAIQLVPAIVDRVSHLDIYQRTPIWLTGSRRSSWSRCAPRWTIPRSRRS